MATIESCSVLRDIDEGKKAAGDRETPATVRVEVGSVEVVRLNASDSSVVELTNGESLSVNTAAATVASTFGAVSIGSGVYVVPETVATVRGIKFRTGAARKHWAEAPDADGSLVKTVSGRQYTTSTLPAALETALEA